MHDVRFVIQIIKGLIRNYRARRTLMFYTVLTALLLLFFGCTFLQKGLREHPLIFLAYWAVCVWLTGCSVLLAIYDMLRIRAEARAARHKLERETLRKNPDA